MSKTKITIALETIILFLGIMLYYTNVIEAELTIKMCMVPAFLLLASQFSIGKLFKKKEA